MKYLITLCILFGTFNSIAQNRLYQRSGDPFGRTVILDKGEGESYWVKEQRFGFDSTHIHLLSADMDLQLSHVGGFRTSAPLGWMNDAVVVDDDVIIGGASIGFSTLAYALRMDENGDIPWAYYFDDLEDGNDQVHSVFSYDNKLDLFTWADNTDDSYYMINGFTDGTFPLGLKIEAPAEMEIRIDDAAHTGQERDYLVICQADTNNTFSKFLIVMHIDSTGVQSAMMHDHDTSMISELESSNWLIPTSDGHWIYGTLFNDQGTGLAYRMVKMELDGTVIWSKAFYESETRLVIGEPHETSDGGLLFAASREGGLYMVKTDNDANVLWSQEYVQDASEGPPFGRFLLNDQGQLYGYNHTSITEMDEDVNVCDMQAHTGITVVDEPFNTMVVSATSTTVTPSTQDFLHHMRSASYDNILDCQATGIDEFGDFEIELYPNPASGLIRLSTTAKLHGYDLVDSSGRLIAREVDWQSSVIDVSGLECGMYLLQVRTEDGTISRTFFKE